MKIKADIEKFVREHMPEREWEAGKDWVQYSGTWYDNKEYEAIILSLMSGWFGVGVQAIRFESEFSKQFNKKHGVFVNSGSSANLLMLSALKSKNGYNFPTGTKIACPIAGFPTTINPIYQCGFSPVFVDIELDSLNLDTNQAWEVVDRDSSIKAMIFAHALGNSPDMGKVMEIVKQYDLVLLEDCCDALGSKYNGHPLGSYGVMASCSFAPAHHISTGVGGMVCTNDDNLEKIMRSLASWGRSCYCQGKSSLLENGTCGCRFSEWIPELPGEIFDHKYIYNEIGYNLVPLELQAAIGRVQLDKLPEIIRRRNENYNRLHSIFSEYEDLFYLHKAQKNADVSWFAFPVTIKDGVKFKRHDLCIYFEKHKIQTRPYFAGNLMMQPAYSGKMSVEDIKKYPVANKVMKDTFFLGVSPMVTSDMIDYIGITLKSFLNDRSRVHS